MSGDDARFVKTLMAHYKKATTSPHPYIKVAMDPSNVAVWYFLIHNLDDAYKGGEYLFKMTAPKDFPFKPPTFVCMTPNGFYETGGPICISIGEFHSNNYRPTLGMMGFAEQVMAGLIDAKNMGHGIRLVNTTDAVKKDLADKSVAFNKKNHQELLNLFDN